MPKVPIYQQRVQPGGLPSPRLGLRVTPNDITGGLDKALDAVSGVIEQKAAAVRKEQREARLMDAYSQLGNARLQIEDTVEKQYQGKAALENDLTSQTAEILKRHADDITASLPDEDLRNGFRRMYLREADGLRGKMMDFVQKQGEGVAEGAFKASLATAKQKAIASDGEGRDALAGREELLAAIGERAGTKGWSKEETDIRRTAELTSLHEGVIDRLRLASPARAQAYLDLQASKPGEMLPEVVTKLRGELKVGVTADRAEQEVRRIEGLTADPEERVKLINALDPEIAPKARQTLREREAMAEEAHNDTQEKKYGTLRDAVSSRAIWSTTALEKRPEFEKLDDKRKADIRDYLLAKQHQAAAEQRARESHAAGKEQNRRDLEFTTWYARQPANVRLTIDVDAEAARRGASVTAANRAGMLQQSTRVNLPRMFDQQGFARQAEQAALTQWPGTGAKAKAIRSGFVSELREWHDAEVEAGRAVDAKALAARSARLLTAGEETTDGWVNDNMTRYEAERRGLGEGFREFPADEQTNPVVKEQGAAPAPPPAFPAAPAGPVRVKTRAEALALPKGTRFIDPNGVERIR